MPSWSLLRVLNKQSQQAFTSQAAKEISGYSGAIFIFNKRIKNENALWRDMCGRDEQQNTQGINKKDNLCLIFAKIIWVFSLAANQQQVLIHLLLTSQNPLLT